LESRRIANTNIESVNPDYYNRILGGIRRLKPADLQQFLAIGSDKSPTPQDVFTLIKAQIAELLLTGEQKAVSTESDTNFTWIVEGFGNLAEVDIEHMRSYASMESRVQQAKLDLSQDILERWVSQVDPTRAKETLHPDSPDRDELLSLHTIRRRFNSYELSSLDLADQDQSAAIVSELMVNLNPRVGENSQNTETEITELIGKVELYGPTYLYRWIAGKEIDGNDVSTQSTLTALEVTRRERIAEAVEITLLRARLIDESGGKLKKNANDQLILAVNPEADSLLRGSLEFRRRDKEVRTFTAEIPGIVLPGEPADDRKAKDRALRLFAFRNLVFNKVLVQAKVKLSDAEYIQLQEKLKDSFQQTASSNDPEQMLVLITTALARIQPESPDASASTSASASITAYLNEQISDLEALTQLFSTKTGDNAVNAGLDQEFTNAKPIDRLAYLFSVEKVPAGLGVRFTSDKLLAKLVGIEQLDLAQVAGVNLQAGNILRNINAEVNFTGGIVAFNERADRHEISHLLDKYILASIENNSEKIESASTYEKFGLAEIVAKINTPSSEQTTTNDGKTPLDHQRPRELEAQGYSSNLLDIGVSPLKLAEWINSQKDLELKEKFYKGKLDLVDLADDQRDEFMTEYANIKQVALIYRMVNRISQYYAKRFAEQPENMEAIRQTLVGILYDCNNSDKSSTDLTAVVRELALSFPEVFDALQLKINNENIIVAAGNGGFQENNSKDTIKKMFTQLIGSDENIFTGTDYASNKNDIYDSALKNIAKAREIYDFSMVIGRSVPGRNPSTDTYGEQLGVNSPDPLGWDRIAREFYIKKGAADLRGASGELKSSFKLSDLTTNRGRNWSYWGEKEPINFIPIKYAGILNSIIGSGLRTVFNFNTRDVASGLAGTDLGRRIGISSYKSSNGRALVETFVGKPAGLWVRHNRAGWISRTTTEGHSYPDFVKNLQIKDRHVSVINAINEKLNGRIPQSEIYSFLETNPLMQIEIVPGDRPNFNAEVSEKKADLIGQFEMRRIQNEVTNLKLLKRNAEEDRKITYSTGDPIDVGKDRKTKFKVKVDESGNFLMTVGDDEREREFSESEVIAFAGDSEMKKNDGQYYDYWRTQEVRYRGEKYYVHYNPTSGMPGLYRQEYIKWNPAGRGRNPEPLTYKDKQGRTLLVEARYCEPYRKVGSEKHKQNMNVAVSGLMNQIMEVRDAQIAGLRRLWVEDKVARDAGENRTASQFIMTPEAERQLYTMKDLIRSIRYYEDPYSQGDGDELFCTKKTINNGNGDVSFYTIRLPKVDPATGLITGEFQEVDYEVANELLTRINRFYIHDKITDTETVVKNLQGEALLREQEIPQNEKVRSMVRGYLQILLSRDFIKSAPGQIDRFYTQQELRDQIEIYIKDERLTEYRLGKSAETVYGRDAARIAEADKQKALIDLYTRLLEYENILIGQYNLFDDTKINDRNKFRAGIQANLGEEVLLNWRNELITNNTAPATTPAQRANLELRANKAWDNMLMDRNKEYNGLDKTDFVEIYIDRLLGAEGRQTVDPAAPRGVRKADRIEFDANTLMDITEQFTNGLTTFIVDPTLPAFALDPFRAVMSAENYVNINFDKRTFTTLMKTIPKWERSRLSSDVMGGINDNLKYRQQTKDKALQMSSLAENFNHEFMKYRFAKGIWDNTAKFFKRFNTIGIYAMIAAMALTGAPAAFALLLVGLGINRYFNPYLDKWTSTAANRRNQARELTRKTRSEVLRIMEKFEKGGTLSTAELADLEDLNLEYELAGEGLQALKMADGWAPNQAFGLDFVNSAVFGDAGLLNVNALLGRKS